MFSKLTGRSEKRAENLVKDLGMIDRFVLLGIYKIPRRQVTRFVNVNNKVCIEEEFDIRKTIPDGHPEFVLVDAVDRLYAEGLLAKFPDKRGARYEPTHDGELAAIYLDALQNCEDSPH